ncbi:hypothetical protein C0993_012775 [Termitomyces sp. T159_Od127]|nr:hypothetical protein C0993_012775 [Termitomyces sp. T159_Od127]
MYVRQSPTTTSTEGYVTTMEKNAYGVAGVGARYRTGYDGADNLQYQVYTDDVHRSQQDVWHNASANPIHTSFVSTLYASDNSPRPKQAPRMSQDSQAQRSGHRYYSQLLKAAGLEPESCSSHSSSGGIGRGMWSHGHKLHVFPDSYEELKAQQSPPTQVSAGAQPGGTAAAGMNDAYGGYVDEYENVH